MQFIVFTALIIITLILMYFYFSFKSYRLNPEKKIQENYRDRVLERYKP